MRVRKLAVCLCMAALCASHAARAQQAAPVASARENAPLPLTLLLGDSKLDAESVRHAVELELGRSVALSPANASGDATSTAQGLSVVVHPDHTVTVSYRAANRVTRTRSIGLPQDPARAPEVIALLSGNLSRDEAAELLAGLAAKANVPAVDTPTTPSEAAEAPAKKPEPITPVARRVASAGPKKPTKLAISDDLQRKSYPLVDLTLAHPVSLIPHSERYVINGELGLAYSRVGAIEGVGVNALILRTERDVHGWTYATFYNRTGGTVYGVTGAGLFESGSDVQGAAISGLVNYGRDVQGFSVAGIWNRARDGRGLQIAGIANVARNLSGVQLSGIANVADAINGAQIGLVNVAGNVSGMQIGLVNVAKHVDGASVGLVSVAGNGRVQPVLWASTFMPVNAAVKFIVGSFYSQVGGGYAPGNHTYTYELGLGAHLPVNRFFVEPGVHYSEQRDANRSFSHELSENVHYRVALGLDLRAVSPFVGVAVMQRFAHAPDAPDSHAVTVEGFGGVAFF